MAACGEVLLRGALALSVGGIGGTARWSGRAGWGVVSLWLIRLRLRLVAGFGWLGRSMAQWPRWAWFLPGGVQALVVFLVVLLAHPGDWGGALTSGVSALVLFTLLWGLPGPRARCAGARWVLCVGSDVGSFGTFLAGEALPH